MSRVTRVVENSTDGMSRTPTPTVVPVRGVGVDPGVKIEERLVRVAGCCYAVWWAHCRLRCLRLLLTHLASRKCRHALS